MRQYLSRLLAKHEELRSAAAAILDQAAAEDRDLTDSENATVADLDKQQTEILERAKPLQAAELREAKHAEFQAELDLARRKAENGPVVEVRDAKAGDVAKAEFRGVGDYVLRYADAVAHPTTPKSAEFRALAHQLLADNPEIVPEPILGPMLNTFNASRPFLASIANRPLPGGGKVFTRPKFTQHALVGEQLVEKTDLASQKLAFDEITVTKRTFGGQLNISFQNRDWTDPAILDIAVGDLFDVYAKQTDTVYATQFVADVTGTALLPPTATWEDTVEALFGAQAQIQLATNQFADTLWLSPDKWATFGALQTAAGLPATSLSPSSQSGSVAGIRVVVDNNFPTLTAILGNSRFAEFYEQTARLMSVTEVSILGFLIAVYGYSAYTLLDPAAFVKFTAV